MKKTSSDPSPLSDRIRSWARSQAYGGSKRSTGPDSSGTLPVTEPNRPTSANQSGATKDQNGSRNGSRSNSTALGGTSSQPSKEKPKDTGTASGPPPASSTEAEGEGTVIETKDAQKKHNVIVRFFLTGKKILFHSWVNVLLVFVPVGIAVAQIPGMPAGAVFGINAIAIIPLAGLLSHATESVARKLGDTIGALLNVTFGNAVELIIFIIALVKDEIRIVQASLLGSILANLLLILGMSFLLGGLRFQEQIYNSTVTQMSACLLSLSVISLVLPTAFHASFQNMDLADERSLKISRGTSVILLLVYLVYLLFQLKSHAYMYESTPQHIIDEEATPGPVAGWLDSSSDSDSSSSSDSDDSSHSRNTVSRRMRRVMRAGRRRKSSVASIDTDALPGPTRTPSFGTTSSPQDELKSEGRPGFGPRVNSAEGSEEAIEDEGKSRKKRHAKNRKHKHHRHRKNSVPLSTEEAGAANGGDILVPVSENAISGPEQAGEPRRVDFADTLVDTSNDQENTETSGTKRPFSGLRGLSFRPVAKLAPPVFTQPPNTNTGPSTSAGPVPRVRYGIRRTNSLPDRLNNHQFRAPGAMMPSQVPLAALAAGAETEAETHEDDLSHKAAIIMLLISTGLVAICAEFMVSAIDAVVSGGGVGEIFIGLILLPIVGNAAEHVTAITVAMKNKMDLAIGVAVGSSIQIALFITPLIVILGWILNREMTLYFTLFETVCLFVSTFIVNFLVLDGRSNYLEGALLCSTYIIIAVVAFFYPDGADASPWSN